MNLYKGRHGYHVLEYRTTIDLLLHTVSIKYNRLIAVRVDLHIPPIIDNGDTIVCFHNDSPGEISRFRNSLNAKVKTDQNRKRKKGTRVYDSRIYIIWAREYTKSGKRHYHICLLFNKDAYYHLGDLDQDGTLRCMITGAWYSALGLDVDDYNGLVHYPANCRYVLNTNAPDYENQYDALLKRLDYLTKVNSKVFGEGERNFGCSQV
ncbi:inovirus Gp2 family protein [Escherichia coli]|nr:inovirus Gp2 family protein [Escherichia coli]